MPTLSYDQPSNHISTAGYVYDLAGNLTRGQDAAGAWQKYEYDAAGRLYIVRDDAGNQLFANFYGTGRQRFASLNYNGSDYTLYVWGGSQVIAEYAVNAANFAAVSWRKIYIYAGSRLLSTFTNNNQGGETLEYQHPDRLGTKLITNNTANTSFEQSTLPFGTALDAETSGTTNQRFTSYDRSAITNLDYAVNRSYSSAQSRFTSVDPIGMSATSITNPQSMNLYAYVGNNPIDNIDPSGLFMQGVKPKDDAPVLPPEIVTVPISFDDGPISWGGGGGSGSVRYLPVRSMPSEISIGGGDNVVGVVDVYDGGPDPVQTDTYPGGKVNPIAQLAPCYELFVPTFDKLASENPAALTLLNNSGGQGIYNGMTTYEKAVFLNTAAAAATTEENFSAAKFIAFYIGDKAGALPFGIYATGLKESHNRSDGPGSVERELEKHKGPFKGKVHLDVDLFEGGFPAVLYSGHKGEVDFNRKYKHTTHPGDVILQLAKRGVSTGVSCRRQP